MIYLAEWLSLIEELLNVLFQLTINILNVVGVSVLFIGMIFMLFKFITDKISSIGRSNKGESTSGIIVLCKDFPRYLTLSLEIFIAAEIISTVLVKTWDAVLTLIAIIAARAFLGFIIHLEEKWVK